MPLTKVTGGEIDGASSINVTGIVTATSFSGNLTGNVTGTASTAQGLTGTPNISVGVITATSITATNATFTGNVSVAGTVTYDDVTNVDSIGIVTARTGVRIDAGGLVVTAGIATVNSELDVGVGGTAFTVLPSGNVGVGVTNPSSKLQVQGTIGFGATDDTETSSPGGRTKLTSSASGFILNHNDNSPTIFQNQGTETVRITSSGLVGIGTTNPQNALHIGGGGNIKLNRADNQRSSLIFHDNNGFNINANSSGDDVIINAGNVSGRIILQNNSLTTLTVQDRTVLVGTATSSGTADQKLQVNGGAYVSGNLGIGTTNPSGKLDVRGTIFVNGGDPNGGRISATTGTNGGSLQLQDGNGRQTLQIDSPGSGTIINHVFNASGNLGIGTTNPITKLDVFVNGGEGLPSVVTGERMRIISNDIVSRSGYLSIIAGSSAYSGVFFGDKDAADIGKIRYYHADNSLQFLVNGTTEALRINSTGNVGIGTDTNIVDRLLVVGAMAKQSSSSGWGIVVSDANTDGAAGRGGAIAFGARRTDGGNFNAAAVSGAKSNSTGMNENGDLVFWTATSSFLGERMRIDSAGNVGINDSNPSARVTGFIVRGTDTRYFSVSNPSGTPTYRFDDNGVGLMDFQNLGMTGANHGMGIKFTLASASSSTVMAGAIQCKTEQSWTATAGTNDSYLSFQTALDGSSTEKVRINSLGALKVATNGASYDNASSGLVEFVNSINDTAVLIRNGSSTLNGARAGIDMWYSAADPNSTTASFFQGRAGATPTTRVDIRSNGGLANFQANNVNLCDEREKKNIENLDSTWDCLKHWEVKKFHYNTDADTEAKKYGVIAQQVEEHCPEVITEWYKRTAQPAKLDEEGNEIESAVEEVVRMGVKEQQMYWMAIKALQEAQERIEQLEAKVAALESKQPE